MDPGRVGDEGALDDLECLSPGNRGIASVVTLALVGAAIIAAVILAVL